MNKPQKKRELTAEEQRECAALNALYKAKKKELGLSQEKIAIDGLKANSQSAASHYLTGRNALNVEAASVFARYLKEPVSAFSPRLARQIAQMSEVEPSNVSMVDQPALMYRYPVINWVEAGDWAEAVEPFPPGFGDAYELSDYDSKGQAFWLKVRGDSMTAPTGTSIPEGMMILIDTEADVQPGKLVIAKLPASNEATFKKLVEDGGVRYLRPLNPDYKMIECGEDCRIIGVAVRVMGKL
jgi:SOS-response transcriptional repressor LexA